MCFRLPHPHAVLITLISHRHEILANDDSRDHYSVHLLFDSFLTFSPRTYMEQLCRWTDYLYLQFILSIRNRVPENENTRSRFVRDCSRMTIAFFNLKHTRAFSLHEPVSSSFKLSTGEVRTVFHRYSATLSFPLKTISPISHTSVSQLVA